MARDRAPLAARLTLWVTTALFAAPLVWMVLASFKSPEELVAEPHRPIPRTWQIENYRDAVTTMPYFRYLRNTLLYCVGSVVGAVLSCSLVAYGFSRIDWPGRNLLFGVLIATMLLPWHATMIPRFLLIQELGLYNTLWALIVPTFGAEAFYVFLLRQFFLTIPRDLSDAARLDGCSELGIFWRVILPLSTPALATVALFQFVAAWNDYGGPLLYLSDPAKFPLAYGLERLVSSYSSQTHLLLAGAVLFTLPLVVLFFFTQRTFLKGIATTGMKG